MAVMVMIVSAAPSCRTLREWSRACNRHKRRQELPYPYIYLWYVCVCLIVTDLGDVSISISTPRARGAMQLRLLEAGGHWQLIPSTRYLIPHGHGREYSAVQCVCSMHATTGPPCRATISHLKGSLLAQPIEVEVLIIWR